MNFKLLSLLCFLGLLFSCSESVQDIDRVQPHALKKSLFVGQWYARQTLVDRPPEFGYLFTGIEGGLEKIEWEIREQQLIARRTYEVVPGLDPLANAPGGELKGSPVAIFPIMQHFDIMRQFNPSTGEQSNVIQENISLNPWYEREYMRVDWSRNLVDSPLDLSGFLQMNPFTGLPSTSQWVRETNPDDPDHWQIQDDFIMITSQYVLYDGGYSCFMNYASPTAGANTCGSVELKIRHAFAKVDEEEVRQFEPVSHLDRELLHTDEATTYTHLSAGPDREALVEVACTDEILETFKDEIQPHDCQELKWDHHGRFGYFRSQRTGYDRRVGGAHDEARIYLANHHQVWEQTKDEEGNEIPLEQRQVRPVIYYLNPHFPNDLKLTALKLARDWDKAFMQSVALATRRSEDEIRQELAQRSQLRNERAVYLRDENGDSWGHDRMFQIRENQCSLKGIELFLEEYPDFSPYLEDLTYNEEGEDFEEIPAGRLEKACSRLTYYSQKEKVERPFTWQQMGDPRFSFLWWIEEDQPSGPLGYGPSSADLETGQIISGNAYIYGGALDRYARSAADMVRALNGDLCSEFGLSPGDNECVLDGDDLQTWITKGGHSPAIPEISSAFQNRISTRLNLNPSAVPSPSAQSDSNQAGQSHAQAHYGSYGTWMRNLHRRLSLNNAQDPLQALLNAPLGQTQAIMDAVAQDPIMRAKMVTPEIIDLVKPLFGLNRDDEPSQDVLDFALEAVMNPDQIQERIRQRQQFYQERNVFLPDGLDDSILGQALELKDLEPQEIYTQLRKELFEAVALHEIGHTVGLRHNFQASFDALNYQDEFWEIREMSDPEEWAEQRLPEHRYASIMDYGSRFNSDTKGLGKYDYAAIKYVYAGYVETFKDDVDVPTSFKMVKDLNDYSRIPEILGGRDQITRRIDRPIEELKAERKEGVLRNARLVIEDRDQSPRNFWSDRTVPYGFCSDEYNGDLKCRTWDEGANHTEAVKAAIDRYWQFYLLDSYRRGQNANTYLNRFFGRMGRLAEYMRYPWQFYVFYDEFNVDLRTDLLQATVLGLNFMNQVMSTPEPGYYCRYKNDNLYIPRGYVRDPGTEECDLYVPYGPARDMWIDFSDDYVYQINYIGTYYDKINLFTSFVNQATRFFRLTDMSDDRMYSINFYQGFKREILTLIRDMAYSALPIQFLNADNMPTLYSQLGSSLQMRVENADFVHYPMIQSGNEALLPEVGPESLPNPQKEAEGGDRIFTYIPYNLVWQGTALAALFNTTRYDQQTDLVDYLAIDEVGSGDQRQVSENQDVMYFTDPNQGQTYQAFQTLDGLSVSYEILRTAEEFKNGPWQRAYEAFQNNPDNSTYRSEFNSRDYYLQQFIEFINDLRLIRSFVDVGR